MKKTMAEHKVKLLLSSLVILLPAALGWQILWRERWGCPFMCRVIPP